MRQGSEGLDRLKKAAHEMGTVMGDETAAKAEVLNDKLDTFTQALKTQLYTALIEGVDTLLPAIVRGLDNLQIAFGHVAGRLKVMAAMFIGIGAGLQKVAALTIGLGRSISGSIQKAAELVPAYMKLATANMRAGIYSMVNAAAEAGDKALAKAPYFVKNLFGYEDGSLGSAGSAMSDAADAQVAAAVGAITAIKEAYAQETGPSALETQLMGNAEESIKKAIALAMEGTAQIRDAVSLSSGQTEGLATRVNNGVDAVSTPQDPTVDATVVDTDKKMALEKKVQDMRRVGHLQVIGFAKSQVKEGSAAAKILIAMETALNVARNISAGAVAATVARTVDPTGVLSASVMAQTSLNTALIIAAGASAIIGSAHDGLDNVPTTGTYMLQKGERVVGKRLNGDLKEAIGPGGQMAGGNGTQNITFAVTGVQDPDIINQVIQENRGEFESMLRQIDSDRAGAGLL